MSLLEPWILFRLIAGIVAAVFFVRAAVVALRVLRYFDASRATEGQLALERQLELSSTFARIAAVLQAGVLALTVVAADRLSRGVRGAMCAYGVFRANEWGPRALLVTAAVAIAAGVLSQLYAMDTRVRGMDLARPIAAATIAMAPLAILDFAVTSMFLGKLDLTVTASCCSVQLDSASSAASSYASGPRLLAATLAPLAIALSVGIALLAARKPRPPLVVLAGGLSLATLPIAVAAAVLEVAPYAFEVPQHACPFCLLKADAFFLGYPLFASIVVAVVWGLGAGGAALLARGPAAHAAFSSFASERLRLGAVAWLVALVIGVAPVVRYAILSGGGSLFR